MVRLNAFNRSEDSVPDSVRPFCQTCDDEDVLRRVVRFRVIVTTCATAGTIYKIAAGAATGRDRERAKRQSPLKVADFTHCFIGQSSFHLARE